MPAAGRSRLERISGHVTAANRREVATGTDNGRVATPVTANDSAAAALVYAAPWLVAGGISASWAFWPALLSAVSTLLNRDGLGGTTLTAELLAEMADSSSTATSVPIGHPNQLGGRE